MTDTAQGLLDLGPAEPQPAPGAVVIYESPRAKLWLGDCADVIVDLPADSVDLIATDPVYGVNWQSNRRTKSPRFDRLAGDDGSLDVPAMLGAATYALKNARHVYVFGYTAEQLAEPMRLSATAALIWDKQMLGAGDLSVKWSPSFEPITFGVHINRPSNRVRGDGGLAARMRAQSIIRVPRPNSSGVRRHATEKPVPLMRQLVESSSLPGDVVFDPFAGSCSTLVAAILAGRVGWGVEKTPKIAHAAIERLREAERIADLIEAA